MKVTEPSRKRQLCPLFHRRNNERFLPGLNSVFDDQVVNGTSFDVPLDPELDKNRSVDFDDYGFFDKGIR